MLEVVQVFIEYNNNVRIANQILPHSRIAALQLIVYII